jgi:hypothetical protein
VAGVSVLDDVLTALVTIFQTAVGSPVPVYDGLPATASADLAFVVVGDDGDPAGGGTPAGTVTQARGVDRIDGRTTESGDVTCALICQTGDDDLPGLRVTSRTLMAALEAAVRADRTLAGVVIRSNVDTVDVWQTRNANGSAVRRVFTVHYDANQG